MSKHIVLQNIKRSSLFAYALVLTLSSMLPLILSRPVSAAQLGARFIDMSATQASEGDGSASGTSVTYSVSFVLSTSSSNLEGVVIDFCSDSPIVGETCTAPTGFSLGSYSVDNNVGTYNITSWATTSSDANTLILSDGTGIATTANGTNKIAFDITGITNPSTVGTFYARIVTYDDSATAQAYSDTAPGTHTDEGGIALSTANELTVTARVQEILEFCVGTETSSTGLSSLETGDNCTDVAGTDLDLGVIDGSISTTASNTTGVDNDGLMMIRTNALNGASIYYKAVQETSSGKLKQAGASCVDNVSVADACFNSIGSGAGTRAAISAGTEAFGVALKNYSTTTGGATTALVCDTAYKGDGNDCTSTVAGNNYAWLDNGTFDTLASSTGPIDDELVRMEFAATASPTTPTGLYNVTANFVATSTF